MGLLHPKPYRVKRNNIWVWVYPSPVEYVSGISQRGGKLKIVQSAKNTKHES